MNYIETMSREEAVYNLKNAITEFTNIQEDLDNPKPNKPKINPKKLMSVRNIINVLHLTPFTVLRNFWPNISLNSHKNRNMNQENREPDTLEKMRLLEDMSLFRLLGKTGPTKGRTGAHNIIPSEKGLFGRWNNFLTLDGHGENLDYRGIPGSYFEGVQCIYNENTGKLVTEDLNKGTFDYYHPSKSNLKHFFYDILPWVAWSNYGDDTLRKQAIPRATWKKIENVWNSYSRNEIDKVESHRQISEIMEANHPIRNKVQLTVNTGDRPDFDEMEKQETQSSDGYYVISLPDDTSIKILTSSYSSTEAASLVQHLLGKF
jgi:predicted RNase H-like HicB family nuclease